MSDITYVNAPNTKLGKDFAAYIKGYSLIDVDYFARLMCELGIKPRNEKQIEALRLIDKYYLSNEKIKDLMNNDGTLIFAFEGTGSYAYPWAYGKNETAYHESGRYGAMMIVVKGNKIEYITTKASTLPDGNHSIVKDGVYTYLHGYHKQDKTQPVKDKYPALNPSPAYQPSAKAGGGSIGGANIHAGGNKKTSKGTEFSTACQIINGSDYVAFGKAIGFIKANAKNPTTLTDIKSDLGYLNDLKSKDAEVTYILDRTLMPDAQKQLFGI